MARATAICILHIVESFRRYSTIEEKIISNLGYSTSFTRNQKQQCRNRYQNLRYSFDKSPPRKLMEVSWFRGVMLRLAISSALLNIFFLTLSITIFPLHWPRNYLSRSMKKTTSCKKATELPGQTLSLIGQKNIFLPNQRDGIRPLLELAR